MSGKIRTAVYILLFIVAFAVKFRGFNSPPYDKHNFRQTQTLVTIEDYYEQGIDLLMPKTHYVGNPGYHVLELPVFQGFCAWAWRFVGPGPWSVRLVNILSGLISAYLLFLIVRRFFDRETALLSSLLFLLCPLNMVYHRSMLIEPWGVLFLLSTLFLYLSDEPQTFVGIAAKAVLFTLSISLAALVKALYLFPFVIIFLATFYKKPKRAMILYWIGIVIALCLLGRWMMHCSEINGYGYFTNYLSVQKHIGFKAFFTPSFWMAMTFRAVNRFAPGTGLGLLLVSLIIAFCGNAIFSKELNRGAGAQNSETENDNCRERQQGCVNGEMVYSSTAVCRILWGIIIGYLLAFAAMNRIHDYYQMALMPVAAVLMAHGLLSISSLINKEEVVNILKTVTVLGFAVPSLVFFWLYSAPVSGILKFRDRVAPLVVPENRFAFLFYTQSPYGGSFELFPKVASMYSVQKWGRFFQVKSVEDILTRLRKFPKHVLHSSGEIITYQVPYLNKEQEAELASMGFQLYKQNRYAQVFRLTGFPVVNPWAIEKAKSAGDGK